MIKEVIFDIDNTVYDYDRGHVEGMRRMGDYVLEHFQVPREEFEAVPGDYEGDHGALGDE